MPAPVNISGSRAAGILGMSDYQTPVRIWLEIMGQEFCEQNNFEFPVFEGNAATRFGQAFEREILNAVSRKHGTRITHKQAFYEKDYLTCHVDGIMGDVLIEAKTTTLHNFYDQYGEEGTDKIPAVYQIQIQHNLYLTGLQEAILPVLIFPRRQDEMESEGIIPENLNTLRWVNVLADMGLLKYYHIHANSELQKLMLSYYKKFWENNILASTPPEICTYNDIKSLCPVAAGTIVGDEEIERLAAEYKNITSEIGTSGPLYKRKEQIRVEILKRMRDADKTMDEDSEKKWVLRSRDGKKLFQYDGKVFR